MKTMSHGRKNRFFTAALVLSTFFILQIGFVPNSFSLPANSVEKGDSPQERGQSSFSGVEFDVPHLREILPNREIRIVEDLYVFTDPSDSNFLQVVERLPEGGFGRLLRYRGMNDREELTDLEFIYEDEAERLTLLDHAAGKFYRTTFTGNRPDPLSAFPLKDQTPNGDLLAIPAPPLKYFTAGGPVILSAPPKIDWLHSQFEARFDQDIWTSRHVRGPPAEVILP